MPSHSSLACVAASILALAGRTLGFDMGQMMGGAMGDAKKKMDEAPGHTIKVGQGGSGMSKKDFPAPRCARFSCPKGQKAAPKVDYQVWSYGCKDSAMQSIQNSMASQNPNMPKMPKPKNQKDLNQCCVERDICQQTCGMPAGACHDLYHTCSQEACMGDPMCSVEAMLGNMMPTDFEADEDEEYDPDDGSTNPAVAESMKCYDYKQGQAAACMCVPKKKYRNATEYKLKSIYKTYNPDMLDRSGEIKDSDELWTEWEDNEPELIRALTVKYKAKAVEMRKRTNKPPGKPKPKKKWGTMDADDEAFEEEVERLLDIKRKAFDDEDHDLIDQVKDEVDELIAKEKKRLKAKLKANKNPQAIEAEMGGQQVKFQGPPEDIEETKRLKKRLFRLTEL